jgi:hypothetical protein
MYSYCRCIVVVTVTPGVLHIATMRGKTWTRMVLKGEEAQGSGNARGRRREAGHGCDDFIHGKWESK